MGREERKGNRRDRISKTNRKPPSMGYYYIVTDTKETEKNYLDGLYQSLPASIKDRLVIKVKRTATASLVKEALENINTEAQYRELWIVFDHDRVTEFDNIIKEAQAHGVKTGWSNPCIEIWFNAYFGRMPIVLESTKCNKNFEVVYKQRTGHEYDKSDPALYKKLIACGDEQKALRIAENQYKRQSALHPNQPSEMHSTTTLHTLVYAIRNAVNAN